MQKYPVCMIIYKLQSLYLQAPPQTLPTQSATSSSTSSTTPRRPDCLLWCWCLWQWWGYRWWLKGETFGDDIFNHPASAWLFVVMMILMITTKTPRQPDCRDDEDACDRNDNTNYDHDEHTNDDDTDATGTENIVDLMTDDGWYLMLPMLLIQGWLDVAEISSTVICLSSLCYFSGKLSFLILIFIHI